MKVMLDDGAYTRRMKMPKKVDTEIIQKTIKVIPRADGEGGFTQSRMTEKSLPGSFEYTIAGHRAVPGEFGTYEAFFDYSMAVRRLGELEDAIYGRDENADPEYYKAYDIRLEKGYEK